MRNCERGDRFMMKDFRRVDKTRQFRKGKNQLTETKQSHTFSSTLSPSIAQLQSFLAQPVVPMNQASVEKAQKIIGNQATAQLLKSHIQFGGTVQREVMLEEEELQLKAEENQIPERADESPLQLKQNTSQRVENRTGLPDPLRSGVERLSGMDLSDVQVHYNSDKPAQLGAHAYAQGHDIHVGPGQEQHLPHEAWHVVQQREDRVRPTMQLKEGIPINDDVALEKEADRMGAQALKLGEQEHDL